MSNKMRKFAGTKLLFMEKEEKYKLLKQQIEALVAGEDDSVSVMANVSAAIHQEMGFFWTGFYIVKGEACRNHCGS